LVESGLDESGSPFYLTDVKTVTTVAPGYDAAGNVTHYRVSQGDVVTDYGKAARDARYRHRARVLQRSMRWVASYKVQWARRCNRSTRCIVRMLTCLGRVSRERHSLAYLLLEPRWEVR
jgi:hypothetical protein